ncbi:MAG: NADH-quinone oxidoreductase subunit NuoK [Acidobacteria bacterium]|nr:MAG: NADH-quinone oxidoreductase subunit NuoK [Acidobacteriota bacterium]
MMLAPVTSMHYLVLSLILFCIGVVGVLTRRNAIIIMMSIELMLNAATINFVAFNGQIIAAGGHDNHVGQIFALFIIAVAAAEAAIGLAIVIALMRTRDSLNVDEIDLMKG